MRDDVVHVGEVCESYVPDVDFIRPCGVLFWLSVVCFVIDCVGQLFVECVCYLCG